MARDFPGSGSNFLGVAEGADITGIALTVAAWIRPDTVAAGEGAVVSKDGATGATTQYSLYRNGTNVRFFIGDGAGTDELNTGGGLSVGAWAHVAGVKNGTGAGALRSFVNGTLVGSATSNRSIQNTAWALRVGNRDGVANVPFDGRVADVAIWNVGLTNAEVAALAKGVSPLRVRPKNLVAYYPLWGVGAAGEPDLSGNGKHLTETGTVGVADHSPSGPIVV